MRFVLALGLLACALLGPAAGALAADDPEIRVLSTRPELVSGGDALVEVRPAGAKVTLDGRDVTDAFAVRAGGRYLGLVTGIPDGPAELRAAGVRLRIVGHPQGGPVTAGPQIQPWTCAEGAQDAQCNRPVEYAFRYKSTRGGSLRPYDPENPPSDVATTTTDTGDEVPFIVRQETGVLDRDEYRIAVLYDPAKPWDPRAPQKGFNRKMVIFHGASCETEYQQGEAPDVLNETALGRGFVTMSHALDNAGHNCNIVTQAESLIMTKERVVEQYGELRYTIGSGCSGGSLTQQQVANAYPGVYQGITPACSFADAWSTAGQYVNYQILRRYFENPSRWAPGVVWTPDTIGAVYGHPNPANAVTFTEVIPSSGEPTRDCPGVPPEQVYDEESNPDGVRCTLHDYMVNVFGRRAQDGFAGRPLGNIGMEYGRTALVTGRLSPAQFVDVNTKAGSFDIDYDPTEERTDADRPALERVYRSGAINQADHLDQVAIIDFRGPDPGAFHDVYRTYVMRARLLREHGTAANQVLWRGQVPIVGDSTFKDASILAMDEWLAAVERDDRDVPLARKIIEDRPSTLVDRCTDGNGRDIPSAECDAVVQAYSDPQIEAGMPLTDDVARCVLKPLRREDYGDVTFTDAQWQGLQQAFPQGVCDWSRPGVDRTPTVPWLSYQDDRGRVVFGGRPLGRVPRSEPVGALGAPAARRCVSRRRFRVRVRPPRGTRLRVARVYVNGKRTATRRGRRLRVPVDLRGLPKGVVRVRIVARTRGGRRFVVKRRYRTCTPKRAGRRTGARRRG